MYKAVNHKTLGIKKKARALRALENRRKASVTQVVSVNLREEPQCGKHWKHT